MRETFVMYTSYNEKTKMLSDEELGKLMRAIFEYEKKDDPEAKEPIMEMLNDTPSVCVAFMFIADELDRLNAKYKAKSENGKQGGRPKKLDEENENLKKANKKLKKANESEQKANETLYVNDNVNVNVNDNVNSLEEETSKEEETDAVPSPPSLFASFESEFARPLSPIEAEKIGQMEKDYGADLVQLALAEGVLHNARSMRYIEVVLSAWKQAGVRTVDEAKAQIERKTKKAPQPDAKLPDWYADTGSSGSADTEGIKKLQEQLRRKA